MAAFNIPYKLSLKGNVAQNWKIFIQQFEIYLIAAEKDAKADKIKISLLLNFVTRLRNIRTCSNVTQESRKKLRLGSPTSATVVNALKNNFQDQNKYRLKKKHENNSSEKFKISQNASDSAKFHCRNCGTLHGVRECPAFHKICNKCKKSNHFAEICRSNVQRKVNELEFESDNEYNSLLVKEITVINPKINIYKKVEAVKAVKNNEWWETICLNQKPMKMQLDSASEINILSQNSFKQNFKAS
ncbi:uncharacterized protein LOC124296599 [Neodiprion lecontei]|uniref:Uncharacterized protein LOC124296599 n=1 Tax=Neodiprion lecontei TaxID=441921 RepID=A0ABM3GQQ0_NEOLC|nr:uncharacterized protein LOC124296599 [Neodiprion lecontei]